MPMQLKKEKAQSIWWDKNSETVNIIDQRKLPFSYQTLELETVDNAWWAIKEMVVRGAPLIGVTAAYGLYLWAKQAKNITNITKAAAYLKTARPTAVNLEKVIDYIIKEVEVLPTMAQASGILLKLAQKVEKQEVENCSKIGDFGLPLIEAAAENKKGDTVNILTHCNAGWLACVRWGTATSPIYKAHQKGIKVHVWVDETRPRNQGSRLTAWELKNAGIPYTVIADNTGGHLMQQNMVDMVLVGSDRTTLNGDVANKIGTYLKALAAFDNGIPFYVALPSSSIDFNMVDGIKNIPIEQRNNRELTLMEGKLKNKVREFEIMPEDTPVANYSFDITPAKYVTGLITERGICGANQKEIVELFPEQK